jgi:hypothetical protein
MVVGCTCTRHLGPGSPDHIKSRPRVMADASVSLLIASLSSLSLPAQIQIESTPGDRGLLPGSARRGGWRRSRGGQPPLRLLLPGAPPSPDPSLPRHPSPNQGHAGGERVVGDELVVPAAWSSSSSPVGRRRWREQSACRRAAGAAGGCRSGAPDPDPALPGAGYARSRARAAAPSASSSQRLSGTTPVSSAFRGICSLQRLQSGGWRGDRVHHRGFEVARAELVCRPAPTTTTSST